VAAIEVSPSAFGSEVVVARRKIEHAGCVVDVLRQRVLDRAAKAGESAAERQRQRIRTACAGGFDLKHTGAVT
jgi:hypothetical protein